MSPFQAYLPTPPCVCKNTTVDLTYQDSFSPFLLSVLTLGNAFGIWKMPTTEFSSSPRLLPRCWTNDQNDLRSTSLAVEFWFMQGRFIELTLYSRFIGQSINLSRCERSEQYFYFLSQKPFLTLFYPFQILLNSSKCCDFTV